MKQFIVGRTKSLGYAAKGIYLLVTTEHSIMAQLMVGATLITMGFYFDISRLDWILQIFCMSFVLAMEGLNTAVEKIADFVHPEHHEKIGFIKDIAAGAVLLSGGPCFIICCLIYSQYIKF